MTKYDFHFHSNYSDGYWDADGILEYAQKIGMRGMILTDHDEIDGQKDFIPKAKESGISTSTGIEITAKHRYFDVHILGYGIDLNDGRLKKMLEDNQKARVDRNKKVLAKMREFGFIISEQRLEEEEKKSNGYLGRLKVSNLILENPANHRLLKNPTNKGVFDEYLGQKGKAYFLIEKVSPKEGIEIIQQAGGIAVFAHPGEQFKEYDSFEEAAKEFISYGLDGIEAYSQKHHEEQSRYYRDFAEKNNLLVTFGSDDHGWPNTERTMGRIFVEDDQKLANNLFEILKR